MAKIKRPPTKKKQLRKLKNLAHKLWRECVLLKFGSKCVCCGDVNLPNCHHIVSEQLFSYLRYDPDNGILLCPSHHKFNRFSAHKNSLWFAYIVLPTTLVSTTVAYLITEMMKHDGSKYVWTIELYQEVIEKLEFRLAQLKGVPNESE